MMGERLPLLKRTTRKDGMPMTQQHRVYPRGNSSDRASAREESSLEGGVGVVALFWNVHVMEALQ
jgi:hypothetical protein